MKPVLHRPFLCMLCGVPFSGKTTFRGWAFDNNYVHISTDDVIQKTATLFCRTYNECFRDLIKFAEKEIRRELATAVLRNKDVVWDQTNLTVDSRAKKIALLPKDYYKIVYIFPTPDDEVLAKRQSYIEGVKSIPPDVMDGMKANFVYPTYEEGWNEIRTLEKNNVTRLMDV